MADTPPPLARHGSVPKTFTGPPGLLEKAQRRIWDIMTDDLSMRLDHLEKLFGNLAKNMQIPISVRDHGLWLISELRRRL